MPAPLNYTATYATTDRLNADPYAALVVYAMGRDEDDACQAGTDGCAVDHTECNADCEGW